MNLGKKTNQNFVNIPLGNIKEKLEYLCEFYGIEFLKQEESYTSRAPGMGAVYRVKVPNCEGRSSS
ncbi:hypothetical protein B9L21_16870 [Geobacillus uzenensis]|uniref:Uncharacterized protein n=1 Tax=Geobacillus uzenensis TaxID=129339 RepID=A0ABX4DE51_9BACL|nr:hypothetical protein B9L21_16870 [Geobacillus uzenensis]